MKVLDVSSLLSGINETVQKIESLYDQISATQRAVRDFAGLDDALKGQGGSAIRSFYSDGHQPFLIFLFQSLVDYKNVLLDIQAAIDSYESHANGLIRQDFLESDVQNGLETAKKRTIEMTTDANSIIQGIQGILAVRQLDESEVVENVRQGKENVRNVVEELKILDNYEVSRLEQTKDNIQTMKTYITDLESSFKSGDISINDFNVKAIQGLTSYSTIMDSIYNRESQESTMLNEKSIETMPIYKIEKAKDAELEGISEDGKAIVNHAFQDLENGEIDRQEFLKILHGVTKLEEDLAEGNEDVGVDVTLYEYVEKNHITMGTNGYVELISKYINKIGKLVIENGEILMEYPVAKNLAQKVGASAIKHGKNIAGAGTVLGGVGMVAGFGIGMYDDIVNKDRTTGEAIAHNGAATAFGLGTSTIVTGVIAGLSTNPVGWAIIGGAAAGMAATFFFNVAYENNLLGIQDGLDWVGEKIDKAWESTKEIASNVGEAIMDGLDAINPLNWGWW